MESTARFYSLDLSGKWTIKPQTRLCNYLQTQCNYWSLLWQKFNEWSFKISLNTIKVQLPLLIICLEFQMESRTCFIYFDPKYHKSLVSITWINLLWSAEHQHCLLAKHMFQKSIREVSCCMLSKYFSSFLKVE